MYKARDIPTYLPANSISRSIIVYGIIVIPRIVDRLVGFSIIHFNYYHLEWGPRN